MPYRMKFSSYGFEEKLIRLSCLAAARSRSRENDTQSFSNTLAPLRYLVKQDFIARRFHPRSRFIPQKADLVEKDSGLYKVLSLFLVREMLRVKKTIDYRFLRKDQKPVLRSVPFPVRVKTTHKQKKWWEISSHHK